MLRFSSCCKVVVLKGLTIDEILRAINMKKGTWLVSRKQACSTHGGILYSGPLTTLPPYITLFRTNTKSSLLPYKTILPLLSGGSTRQDCHNPVPAFLSTVDMTTWCLPLNIFKCIHLIRHHYTTSTITNLITSLTACGAAWRPYLESFESLSECLPSTGRSYKTTRVELAFIFIDEWTPTCETGLDGVITGPNMGVSAESHNGMGRRQVFWK